MQYSRLIRLTSRRLLPLAAFIENDPTLKALATDCGQEPVDFVASEFVAEIEKGEQYPDWVLRQVKAVLETRLMADDVKDLPDGQLHVASRVMQAEFDEVDRQWILDTFAERADVKEAWTEAHTKAWASAA
jgi:chromatin segregation and condensation protein Rec8/ScpA/Scc1 (kleisin family)